MRDNLGWIVAAIVFVVFIALIIWATNGAVTCWIDGGIWVKPTVGLPTCVERH